MPKWPLVILLALLLSGCLSDPSAPSEDEQAPETTRLSAEEIAKRLTQPIYQEIQREEAIIEGHDGTELWVDIYRPADAEKEVPVILVKTPYQILGPPLAVASSCGPGGGPEECTKTLQGCLSASDDPCPYSEYLVSFFVPRGYAVAFSDVRGNNKSGGCIDQSGPKQWEDGRIVVQWLAGQDWSNGNVGMHGASYDGETQITTALTNPEGLKTIVPTASVSNQYEYSFYDGVPYDTGALGTSAAYLAISAAPGLHPNAVVTYPERLECQLEVFGAALDQSGDWSTYWEERDYRGGAGEINASVLQTHGLQDWNVKPNHLDEFWNELTSEKRLVIGQWGHRQPAREDWEPILHRWFDHYLHGIDTGILDDLPPVLTQDTEGDWRGIDSFPPLEPENLTLHPGADGSLEEVPGEDARLTVVDHLRQAGATPLPEPALVLQETTTGESHRLVFETQALEESLHYTGRPLVHLKASTDAERTRWAVHLVDVDPEGGTSVINRGYLNTRHLEGLDQPGDLEPGEVYETTIRMFPQDDVIKAGHKLRLVITNADDWVQQDTTYATSQVHLGAEGTRFEIPLAGEGEKIPDDRLREDL